MIPQEQPKKRSIGCEYTINYGAVMTIRQMMINARIDEVLINRIEETICSHPHTPAAPDNELEELGNQDIDPAIFEAYASACNKGAEEQYLKEHDATIRNQTLGELKQGRKVITLCGSVKFWDEYTEWNARLTIEGNIVFSCGLSLKEGYEDLLIDLPLDDVKKDLDFIHLRKIDLSDEIFVLNVGGYIGDSTKREIAYAESKGKRVRYLESLRSTKERELRAHQ